SLVGHFVELPVPGVGPASPSVLHSWRPTGAGPFVLSLLSNAASYWTPLLFLQLAIVARGTRQREAPRP
ncbi:MAG TPA: hypothetical protein VK324_00085, partial [Tepidisphaeraceae bacterium]|nr:hypothetical protein [Tepidisphaeraceae bacterium]